MGPTLKHNARCTIGLPLLFVLLLLLLEETTATDEGGDVSNDVDKQLKVNLEFDEIELDDLSENKAKAEYDYFVSGGAETLENKNLALYSPTDGGHSVGIARLRAYAITIALVFL
uniref:Uncharacterized protein n=1 Tax=Timema poppense TaxID=170557 RepID=A0A7R9DCQ4_TIMPO|nr:unnamed protein product [Timema poppensis]